MGRVRDTRGAGAKAVPEHQDPSGSFCSGAPFFDEEWIEPNASIRAEGAFFPGETEPGAGAAGEVRAPLVCGTLHQPITRPAGNPKGIRNHGGSGGGHALESGNALTGIPPLG